MTLKAAPTKPRQISATGYVVAAFDQARPRFLAEPSRGGAGWVVVLDVARAKQFIDADLARLALAQYATPARRAYSDPGEWRVYEMAARATFLEVDD